jgi:hypothetical protein
MKAQIDRIESKCNSAAHTKKGKNDIVRVTTIGDQSTDVGIVTRCQLDDPRIGPDAHPASCTMGNGSFPGAQRPKRDADHPPPSSVRLRIGCSYTSPSPLCLHNHVMGRPLPLLQCVPFYKVLKQRLSRPPITDQTS